MPRNGKTQSPTCTPVVYPPPPPPRKKLRLWELDVHDMFPRLPQDGIMGVQDLLISLPDCLSRWLKCEKSK